MHGEGGRGITRVTVTGRECCGGQQMKRKGEESRSEQGTGIHPPEAAARFPHFDRCVGSGAGNKGASQVHREHMATAWGGESRLAEVWRRARSPQCALPCFCCASLSPRPPPPSTAHYNIARRVRVSILSLFLWRPRRSRLLPPNALCESVRV